MDLRKKGIEAFHSQHLRNRSLDVQALFQPEAPRDDLREGFELTRRIEGISAEADEDLNACRKRRGTKTIWARGQLRFVAGRKLYCANTRLSSGRKHIRGRHRDDGVHRRAGGRKSCRWSLGDGEEERRIEKKRGGNKVHEGAVPQQNSGAPLFIFSRAGARRTVFDGLGGQHSSDSHVNNRRPHYIDGSARYVGTWVLRTYFVPRRPIPELRTPCKRQPRQGTLSSEHFSFNEHLRSESRFQLTSS